VIKKRVCVAWVDCVTIGTRSQIPFPKTKLAEDGAGQIFRRRFAADFADGVDGDAQIKFGEI
jgi:hypothetical protein